MPPVHDSRFFWELISSDNAISSQRMCLSSLESGSAGKKDSRTCLLMEA